MNTHSFFDSFFHNAKHNAILIMNNSGLILDVNLAFTSAFGYTREDLVQKNFSLLFSHRDQLSRKPEKELKEALAQGAANDENYLLHKNGTLIWVTGESVAIKNSEEETHVIKVIQNVHAKKQLEMFLLEADEFMESIFNSVDDVAMIILDGGMKIVKTNGVFLSLFDIPKTPQKGNRLSDLGSAFWTREDIRTEIRNSIVTNHTPLEKQFEYVTPSGEKKWLSFYSKILDREPGMDKKIFIMMKEIKAQH